MRAVLPLLLSAVLSAGTSCFAAGPIIDPDFAERMNRLEAETEALRAELVRLQQDSVRLPSVGATSVNATMTAPEVDDVDYYTWEELQAEVRRNAWTKGSFKIVPYGFLWGNMVYETARTDPVGRSFTSWARPGNSGVSNGFLVDARGTRLGIDIAGPRLAAFGCAKSGGKVEIDFQGSFAGSENKGGLLLRQAYWEIKTSQYRLLFGEAWDIISPLYPTTTTYSIYWWAGNIGYRRAQLRYERYLDFSDTCLLTLQGSLNQNIMLDGLFDVGDSFVDRRDTGGWPVLEGRAAVTLGYRGPHGLPWTFGVSGHIGNQGFVLFDWITGDFAASRRRTWSINADINMPITDRFGFRGEAFYGENLSAFLGGIGQGINLNGQPIRSKGGWMEVYYYWTPTLHSHVGYGLDDPVNADIQESDSGGFFGPSFFLRTYNQFIFANVMYDVTDKFRLGFEVTSWKTLYKAQQDLPSDPGESVRFEFIGKYAF